MQKNRPFLSDKRDNQLCNEFQATVYSNEDFHKDLVKYLKGEKFDSKFPSLIFHVNIR